MKKVLGLKMFTIIVLGVILSAFQPAQASACEIEFEVVENQKEVYNEGDIIVIKVTVTLTHRSCPIGMDQTKFTMTGLEVLGATDWTQLSTMVWERKVKVKVLKTKNGNLVFNAVRTCDKDGGFGSIKLSAKQ
jgi:hypothetical protein